MDLASLFEFAVARHPKQIAIVDGEQRLTYEAFDNQINRIAYALQSLGLEKGDRIILVTKNRLEMVALYWAIQKLGAIFTPLNFRLSVEEVRYCIQNSEAKAVIYEPVSEQAVLGATEDMDIHLIGLLGAKGATVSYDDLLNHEEVQFQRPNISNDDYALMLYTSGTTGKPKGVPRSHKNEYGAAVAHIIQNNYEVKESTLGVMPLYHTMGMRSLLSMAFLNGKLVMVPDYDPKTTLDILEREQITSVYLVPTIIHDLLHCPDFDQYDLTALKKIGYAGAAMTKALTEQCFEKLKPEIFVNHYGCTEVYTFTVCDYLDKKPGCAGKPGFHQNIRIVTPDPDGHSTPEDIVPNGEPGEIIANIKTIEAFQGYWKNPEATKKAIRDGWYFTGDMGVFDEDGDLFVVGRVDDMIISGGENIHPIEVEDVISLHPKVLEVAVVGLPDERFGEIVTAFVVPKDQTLHPDELDQLCKETPTLANFKRPRKYIFVSELPKSPVGKILRRKLKAGEYKEIDQSKESVK